MSEVLMIPDCNNRNNNNSSLDPALLMTMMMNNGGFGGGSFMWIIFLFFLYPMLRNGMFGNMFGNNCGGNGGGSNGAFYTDSLINNATGREMLMQAINGNASAIQNLANMFSTSTDFIKQAICGVQNSLTTLSGKIDASVPQITNAIQNGNMQIASQLAQCCCEIRESVTKGNYENQIATLQQTQTISSEISGVRNAVTQGFCDTAYSFRDQTCQLGGMIKDSTRSIVDATNAQTNSIMAKLDNMERAGLMDKIDSQRETISLLRTSGNIREQNWATQQMIGSAIAPINAQLAEIRCAQPNTVTVPYQPFTLTPNCGCQNNDRSGSCGSCGCQNQFWY